MKTKKVKNERLQFKKLVFLRHGRFQLPYKEHWEMPFELLAELGLGILNPPIDMSDAEIKLRQLEASGVLKGISRIFTSPSPRCQATADLICAHIASMGTALPTRTTIEQLKEILFDLNDLDSQFNVQRGLRLRGIAAVNTSVFEGMLSGRGAEPIASVEKRVNDIFRLAVQGNTLFITHDFVMRVIELYIRDRNTEDMSVSITDLEKTRRNTYLSGFQTDETHAIFEEIDNE